MSITQHHAIIATTQNPDKMLLATNWIKTLHAKDKIFFEFSPPMRNETFSIVMWPDGSKEGWELSNDCNILRSRFIDEVLRPENWQWVEISYGEQGLNIVDSSEQRGGHQELGEKLENTLAVHWGFIGRVKFVTIALTPPDYTYATTIYNATPDELKIIFNEALLRLKPEKVNGS